MVQPPLWVGMNLIVSFSVFLTIGCNFTNCNGLMLGRDFPFTGFTALVMSECSSLGSLLTILSQASIKACPFLLIGKLFSYIMWLKYIYKNTDGKVVTPEIQKSLITCCCVVKVATQEGFFSWLYLKGNLSGLLSLANTHLSQARNKFDDANFVSTWLPSPPHIWSYPWTLAFLK